MPQLCSRAPRQLQLRARPAHACAACCYHCRSVEHRHGCVLCSRHVLRALHECLVRGSACCRLVRRLASIVQAFAAAGASVCSAACCHRDSSGQGLPAVWPDMCQAPKAHDSTLESRQAAALAPVTLTVSEQASWWPAPVKIFSNLKDHSVAGCEP